MMHGRGRSDAAVVALKPTNKAERSAAEPVEPRAEAKGNASQQNTRRTLEPGKRDPGAGAHTAKQQGKRRRRSSPRSSTTSASNLLEMAFFELKENAAPGVDGLTWRDYEQNLEGNLEDSACSGPSRSISAAAVTAGLHPEAGRAAAPARGRCAGGQDRPAGSGRGAERDLRGRLPRVLVRVPARARRARCTGCAVRRDRQAEGELHPGRRHPVVLRHGEPAMAHPLRRASDRRPAHHPPDPASGSGRACWKTGS